MAAQPMQTAGTGAPGAAPSLMQLGVREIREGLAAKEFSAAEIARAALDAMGLPELDYFMEHCAESFSMTLDELE